MTTNHIERLNDALIRPGRVDVRCFLGPATRQQARDLFVSFYRDLPHLMLQPQVQLGAAAAGAAAAGLQPVEQSQQAPAATGSSAEEVESGPAATTEASAAAVAGAGMDTTATGAAANKRGTGKARQAAEQQQQQLGRSVSLVAAGAEAAAREAVLQELAEQFVVQLPAEGGGVSMAQLQGYLMTHRWVACFTHTSIKAANGSGVVHPEACKPRMVVDEP